MNPKDIRHYKFLRRAIEFKYRFANEPTFETYDYDPYIFRWASNTFYELKLFDYLDIRKREVLVRLYENLKKDSRLKFLDDPDSLKDKDEFKLPESFHQRIEAEKTKLQAVSGQAAPAGGTVTQSTQPASGRGSAFHPPSLPSVASLSSTQGEAVKKETETKTATKKAPPVNIKLPRVSFGAGNVLRNLGSQSSIFLKKNVFGKILTPERLVTGFTTILGGIVGSSLGPIGTLAGAGAGFLTPSYVKTFGAKHLTNFAHWGADSMVRLSSQTSRLSVGGFGGRSVAGKRVAIAAILLFFGVGALAAFAPLPGQQTPPAGATPATPGFIGTLAPPPSQDYQKLHDDIKNKFYIDFDMQNPFDITYLQFAWEKLWNISNTNFLKLVKANDKNIIKVSRNTTAINEQYGCNSIGIRGVSSRNGQPYPKDLFNYVFLHELSHIIDGCNSQSTTNKTSLQQIKNQEGYLTKFSQYADSCPGSKGDININEDFADTLSYFLNPAIPEQSLGIGADCEPTLPAKPPYERNKPLHQQFAAALLGINTPLSPALPQISCPVVGGGPIRIGSFQADLINGHCGSAYNNRLTNQADRCSGNTRRGKSIDVETGGPTGKDVALPTIDGQSVDWEFIQTVPLTQNDCFAEEIPSGGSCGIGLIFRADLGGGGNWVLHLFHMRDPNLTRGEKKSSGAVIGKTDAIHVHISLGKNIQDPLSQTEAGWIPADVELSLCK